ncbi:hypothetical protein QTH89_09500 [Variovorax sp. J22G21]|uniref:hypothetical protein n=1 Tax=Variovorax fucosicus TaxID=3053517 RepID=UPI00257593B7|nr:MULTISPECIES: hypothetical protein [unclassified Variovorax]MDM0040059.1 hypothetical protein [Variovorax sp. J22R193]MDM0054119.1 hypothetical protein [Variovorax sp. J22G47]MDM0061432.1 hypothetical protein [Variovorax sp. J22G21]
MTVKFIRTVPAVLALAFASIGLSATAQTTAPAAPQPTTTEKVKEAGKEAVVATETGAKKAYTATKKTTKKAYNATKSGTKKAVAATKSGVSKAATATENTATKAADGTRAVGDKIGEKIPGTAQNEAAKKP